MHQLAVLSIRWVAFFHLVPDGVHDSPFLFAADHCTFFFLVLARFSVDLTSHIATMFTFLPCSLFYLATALTTYPTNLATVLTTYPINLATILITYPTNLATVLTTYPTNLITLLITYPTLKTLP
jgi:hypothetical protein